MNRQFWLALNIGNSRYHWYLFQGERLQRVWRLPYPEPTVLEVALGAIAVQGPHHLWTTLGLEGFSIPVPVPLWLVSVVPNETRRWQAYPNLHSIILADIPLGQLYPTLGLDRALSVWAAGMDYGFPVLVIDGGTALTLTGATATQTFAGGAILPGLQLQRQALSRGTAALPGLSQPAMLPPRWATNTAEAIQSGILYTVLAGLQTFVADWCCTYPNSAIVFTGGDGPFLHEQLLGQFLAEHLAGHQRCQGAREILDGSAQLKLAPDLIGQGICRLWKYRGDYQNPS